MMNAETLDPSHAYDPAQPQKDYLRWKITLGATRWASPWRISPPAPTSSSISSPHALTPSCPPHVFIFVILFASLGKYGKSIWKSENLKIIACRILHQLWWLMRVRRLSTQGSTLPACLLVLIPSTLAILNVTLRLPREESPTRHVTWNPIQGEHPTWWLTLRSNLINFTCCSPYSPFRLPLRVTCTSICCYVILLLQHVSITLARWQVCLTVRIFPAKSLLCRLHGLWCWFPRSGLLFPELAFHGRLHFRVQIRRLSKYLCK